MMEKRWLGTAQLTLLAIASVLLIAIPVYTQDGPLSGVTVCLDPGHGGSDPGAVNTTESLQEKEINLDVAYGLKALLYASGAEVVMTRTGDDYRSNSERYNSCNAAEADILVSVHTNSVLESDVDGSLALYFHSDDRALARAIYEVMHPYLASSDPSIDPTGFADFGLRRFASGVLLKSDMPAAMMEPLFMSNLAESALLVTPIFLDHGTTSNEDCTECRRTQIAQAIHDGILAYVVPLGPTPTPEPGGTSHVVSISLSLSVRGRVTRATAAVQIADQSGSLVADASVSGDWSLDGSPLSDGATAITAAGGVATIGSGRIRDVGSGAVIGFCVTDVTHASLAYDPAANVETCVETVAP